MCWDNRLLEKCALGSRDEWKLNYAWQISHGLVLWKDIFVNAFFVRSVLRNGRPRSLWDLRDAADGA